MLSQPAWQQQRACTTPEPLLKIKEFIVQCFTKNCWASWTYVLSNRFHLIWPIPIGRTARNSFLGKNLSFMEKSHQREPVPVLVQLWSCRNIKLKWTKKTPKQTKTNPKLNKKNPQAKAARWICVKYASCATNHQLQQQPVLVLGGKKSDKSPFSLPSLDFCLSRVVNQVPPSGTSPTPLFLPRSRPRVSWMPWTFCFPGPWSAP